jgi:hypothetical protein
VKEETIMMKTSLKLVVAVLAVTIASSYAMAEVNWDNGDKDLVKQVTSLTELEVKESKVPAPVPVSLNITKKTEFACKAEDQDGTPFQIVFAVKNDELIETGKNRVVSAIPYAQLNNPAYDQTENVFSSLNDNYALLFPNADLTIYGDADGIFLVTLKLYRKTGYTAGTVKLMGEYNFTGRVTCTVKVK